MAPEGAVRMRNEKGSEFARCTYALQSPNGRGSLYLDVLQMDHAVPEGSDVHVTCPEARLFLFYYSGEKLSAT